MTRITKNYLANWATPKLVGTPPKTYLLFCREQNRCRLGYIYLVTQVMIILSKENWKNGKIRTISLYVLRVKQAIHFQLKVCLAFFTLICNRNTKIQWEHETKKIKSWKKKVICKLEPISDTISKYKSCILYMRLKKKMITYFGLKLCFT